MNLFKQKTNPLKTFVFSKKGLFVLFFLIILFFSFVPSNTSQAKEWYEYLNAATPIAGEINSVAGISGISMDPETGKITEQPGGIVRFFILIMFEFAGFLFQLSSSLFAWIVDVNNIKYIISDNAALYSSWAFVRDILNMAFILVLLFSAFCTIFQVESYNYKKLLWKIVLMALLVNFSFPIARFIIDVSNILMYTLINSLFGDSIVNSAGIIANKSGIGALIDNGSKVTNNTTLLANTILIFMLAVTFLAIGILLLIRIIALAILIIFSPIAFVGTILPGSSSYASKWWDYLFKYAFFGPIMIFGVSITVTLMNDVNMQNIQSAAQNAAIGQKVANPSFLAAIGFAAIPLVLLWMVMGIAQSMSITGAGAVMGSAQKFLGWAGKNLSGYNAGKWFATKAVPAMAKAGIKKIDRDLIGVRGFIKAWNDRTAELEKDKIGTQAARSKDFLSSVFDPNKRDPDFYKDVDENNRIAQYKKEQEMFSTKDADMIYGIQKLEGKKDKESQLRMRAFFQTLAENNDLNEWMKLRNLDFDPYAVKADVEKTLTATGMSPEKVAESLNDLSNISLMKGNYALYGMAKKQVGGKFEVTSNEEQLGAVAGKIKNIDHQKLMINFHPNSIVRERGKLKAGETEENNNRGEVLGTHEVGRAIAAHLEKMGGKFTDRHRGDTVTKVSQAFEMEPKTAKKYPRYVGELEKLIGKNKPADEKGTTSENLGSKMKTVRENRRNKNNQQTT